MYTKLTTMTWGSADEQDLHGPDSPASVERLNYLSNAETLGTTDGIGDRISPEITTRVWLDQIAADSWATFITNLATANDATCVVTITDIV